MTNPFTLTTQVEVDSDYSVRCVVQVSTRLSVDDVWQDMAEWQRFLCHDPLHAWVEPQHGPLQPGRRVRIFHGFKFLSPRLKLGFWRVGRVLEVRPGEGFSFSDLSARGVRVGFPHVYHYALEKNAGGARLRTTVRGRWTAQFIPRWGVRLWLHGIALAMGWMLRAHFWILLLRSRTRNRAGRRG